MNPVFCDSKGNKTWDYKNMNQDKNYVYFSNQIDI
jgi:hypothetical protein